MNISCPQCRGQVEHLQSAAGRQVICPHCRSPFTMPPIGQPVAPPPISIARALPTARRNRHWTQWLMIGLVLAWLPVTITIGGLAYVGTGAPYRHVYGDIYLNDATHETIGGRSLAAAKVAAFFSATICSTVLFGILAIVVLAMWFGTRE